MSDTFDYEPDPFDDEEEQPIPCRRCGRPILFESYWDAAGQGRKRPVSPTGKPHDCISKVSADDFEDMSSD